MVHDLNQKNLHINLLYIYIYIYIYIAKSKKPYICDVFVHYLQNEVFIQKSGCINFTLKAS